MSIPTFKVFIHSYERSGKYTQLHFHAIISMSGKWSPFTQYGDREHMNRTFRLQFSRVTDYPGALAYVIKDTQDIVVRQDTVFLLNYYKHHFFNQTTQEFVSNEMLRSNIDIA